MTQYKVIKTFQIKRRILTVHPTNLFLLQAIQNSLRTSILMAHKTNVLTHYKHILTSWHNGKAPCWKLDWYRWLGAAITLSIVHLLWWSIWHHGYCPRSSGRVGHRHWTNRTCVCLWWLGVGWSWLYAHVGWWWLQLYGRLLRLLTSGYRWHIALRCYDDGCSARCDQWTWHRLRWNIGCIKQILFAFFILKWKNNNIALSDHITEELN